jgi:hypothetical protein
MMRSKNCKTLLAAAMAILILTVAVGGTIAYLVTSDGPITNTFTPSKVTCDVNEEFTDKTTKKNVKIKNTGDTDAYIRVKVVGNWCRTENGKEVVIEPWTDDIKYNSGNGWVKHTDGYHYYTLLVAPEELTANLFDSYTPETKSDGTHLVLNIVCQAVRRWRRLPWAKRGKLRSLRTV